MTRRIAVLTAIAGAALALAAPGFAASNPWEYQYQVQKDDVGAKIDARKRALGRDFQLGDFAANNPWQYQYEVQKDDLGAMIDAREQALGRDFQLGDFAVNNTWQQTPAADPTVTMLDAREQALVGRGNEKSAYERALEARGEALNRQYGLGDYARPPVGDFDRFKIVGPAAPESVTLTSSGSEIEWPQVGIGFAIGMVVLLGLILAVRAGRGRPVAHS